MYMVGHDHPRVELIEVADRLSNSRRRAEWLTHIVEASD
jgi:hypothetical protein